jgi:hypothetical protein
MMDTMAQLQKEQREFVERVREINRIKAKRYLVRVAEKNYWSRADLDLVAASLGLEVGDE